MMQEEGYGNKDAERRLKMQARRRQCNKDARKGTCNNDARKRPR